MKAIILAAGAPVSEGGTAISNAVVRGETLLDIQLSCVRSAGVDEVCVVVGFKGEEVSRADVSIVRNHRWTAGGAITSLAAAMDHLEGEEDLVVCYGDTLFEPAVVQALIRSPESLAALCFLDRSSRDRGQFREYAVVRDAQLHQVVAEPDAEGVRTVFTGLVLVRRPKVAVLREFLGAHLLDEREHLGALLNRMTAFGVPVAPVMVESGWAELASLEVYREGVVDSILLDRVIQIHTDWGERAKRYDRLDWVNDDVLLGALVRAAVAASPATVLDVGTGTGAVLRALRRACPGAQCWGIDKSEAMLERFADREGYELICGDAETLEGAPSAHFDLVTARMVFHHIERADAAMRSIRRVLKPGGVCIVCEGVPPTVRSIPWYTEMFRYKEDRRTLTEVDLIHMLLRAGFGAIRTETVIIERASLNNWLDNAGIPEENVRTIKRLHYQAPASIKEDYDMQLTADDCLMTWRFAITQGSAPAG